MKRTVFPLLCILLASISFGLPAGHIILEQPSISKTITEHTGLDTTVYKIVETKETFVEIVEEDTVIVMRTTEPQQVTDVHIQEQDMTTRSDIVHINTLPGIANITIDAQPGSTAGKCIDYNEHAQECFAWQVIEPTRMNEKIILDVTEKGIYAAIPNETNTTYKPRMFTGLTTNGSNNTPLTLDRPTKGRIDFSTPTTLPIADTEELADAVKIYDNFVEVDTDALAQLNQPATITFYETSYKQAPLIYQDGTLCTSCVLLAHEGSTIFTVPHFTNYTTTANSQLRIYDSADTEGGDADIYHYDYVTFYANYSNATDNTTITGGGTSCTLEANGFNATMNYNATSELYEFTTWYKSSALHTWEARCDGGTTNYEDINLTDTLPVQNRNFRWHQVNVQTNTTSGTGNQSINVNPYALENSFLIHSVRTSDSTPDDNYYTSRMVNTTQISIDKYNPAGATGFITTHLVSSEGIESQRGQQEVLASDTGDNITIDPVNPETSFVIVEGRCADSTTTDNLAAFFTANLTNETNIEIYRGNAGLCAATFAWQVVDWAGTRVHSNDTSIADNTDSVTPTIPSVNLSRSFLVFGSASIGTDPGMDSNLIRGRFTGTTQLEFTDEPGTTYPSSRSDITYYVVQMPEGLVQSNLVGLAADTTEVITAVNLSQSWIMSTWWNTGGGQTWSNSDFVSSFTNASDVLFDKQTGSQTTNLAYFVVDAPDGDPVPRFYDFNVTPLNDSVYSPPEANYTFNVSIYGTNGTAGIVFDGVNYTATNVSEAFSVQLQNLSAGTYTYYWWANGQGIFNPYNESQTFSYVIEKENSSVNLTLNNTRNNITVERLSNVTLNGTRVTGEVGIELYNNGSLINSGPGPLVNDTVFSDNGEYNISVIHPSSTNYNYGIETWFITVVDTTPPNITNVRNQSITDVQALILWDTDEPANSTVDWGNTTALLNMTSDASYVTVHSVLITNLTANTTYYYNVTSCDPSGNCAVNGTFNFTTDTEPDNVSPEIYNVTVIDIRETAANVTWNLSEPANGTVNWGPTTSLGTNVTDSVYTNMKNIEITGLDALTLYYFNVTSCDPSGNCNTTGPYNFTTIDSTPPNSSNIITTPTSGVTYVQGATYEFNTTWTDNIAVDTVLIEHNFTGTLTNYTTTNNSENFSYTTTDLAAGLYTWRMWANDTSGNEAYSNASNYTVNPIQSIVNITLNGSYQNVTIFKRENVTINATIDTPNTGIIEILRDGIIINTSLDNTSIMETFNLVGIYNVTVRYNGSQNHSSAENTLWVTVTNEPPSHSTNVQAENDIATLAGGTLSTTIDLINEYNLSKTFLKVHHAVENPGNSVPDYATTSVHFVNSTHIQLDRYASTNIALVSYSILQADNIKVINFTKSWASLEETDNVTLTEPLDDDYATKCFIETHRNIRLDSADGSSFAEQEIRATILNTTHIELIRDTEGANTADIATQYGYVVCFLDETSVQTNTFTISGDVGSTAQSGISAVTTNESFSAITYYQADDGVGQNSLMANFTSTTQLTFYRDEVGGSQVANGRFYVMDFEDQSDAYVQHISYLAPGTGALLQYTTDNFTAVDRNKTYVSCENTMANGGGTAHTRGQFVYALNDTNNSVGLREGRDRSNTQTSQVNCQIITWPNLTTYQPPPDLIVTNITLPSTMIAEENQTVNITITNNGQAPGENITIQLNVSWWNGTDWIVNSTQYGYQEILYGGNTTIIQIPWNATRGDRNFTAFVDSTNFNEETDETNNVYSDNITVIAPTIAEVAAYIEGVRGDNTVEWFINVTLNGSVIRGDGNITLILNGTNVSNGTSPQEYIANFTTLGQLNFTAFYEGDYINYTNASETWVITVGPGDPPVISNIVATPEETTALIKWDTDSPANSTVHFGPTTALGSLNSTSNDVYTHSVWIGGSFSPLTTYYYMIETCNLSNCTNSSILSFITRPPAQQCILTYLEKGPNWVDGQIKEGDLVQYDCQLPENVGQREQVKITMDWDQTDVTRTVSTPRILYREQEVLYP